MAGDGEGLRNQFVLFFIPLLKVANVYPRTSFDEDDEVKEGEYIALTISNKEYVGKVLKIHGEFISLVAIQKLIENDSSCHKLFQS